MSSFKDLKTKRGGRKNVTGASNTFPGEPEEGKDEFVRAETSVTASRRAAGTFDQDLYDLPSSVEIRQSLSSGRGLYARSSIQKGKRSPDPRQADTC